MKTIKNYYFKKHTGISGIAIPTNDDGVTRNIHFVNCVFHPVLDDHPCENCKFTDCDGKLNYKKTVS